MKKLFALLICFLLLLSFVGCQSGPSDNNSGTSNTDQPPASSLTGTTEEILEKVLDEADKTLTGDDKLVMPLNDPVDKDSAQGVLGITADQFTQSVDEAFSSMAAISSIAHEVVILKCKDAAAAKEIKEIIAAGYDSEKWICVFPEQSLVVESDEYVLLVASSKARAEAIQKAFADLAGSTGEINIFYTGPGDGDGDGEEIPL